MMALKPLKDNKGGCSKQKDDKNAGITELSMRFFAFQIKSLTCIVFCCQNKKLMRKPFFKLIILMKVS